MDEIWYCHKTVDRLGKTSDRCGPNMGEHAKMGMGHNNVDEILYCHKMCWQDH